MDKNHSTTRARSIPHCSKYYKGGKPLKKIYKEVSNMEQNHQHQNHRANSIPNSSKYLKGGTNMERDLDALNGMYDQIEMEELAYYNSLFPEEEGDESNEPSEEVEEVLRSARDARDENHYRHLKEVHERFRGLSS